MRLVHSFLWFLLVMLLLEGTVGITETPQRNKYLEEEYSYEELNNKSQYAEPSTSDSMAASSNEQMYAHHDIKEHGNVIHRDNAKHSHEYYYNDDDDSDGHEEKFDAGNASTTQRQQLTNSIATPNSKILLKHDQNFDKHKSDDSAEYVVAQQHQSPPETQNVAITSRMLTTNQLSSHDQQAEERPDKNVLQSAAATRDFDYYDISSSDSGSSSSSSSEKLFQDAASQTFALNKGATVPTSTVHYDMATTAMNYLRQYTKSTPTVATATPTTATTTTKTTTIVTTLGTQNPTIPTTVVPVPIMTTLRAQGKQPKNIHIANKPPAILPSEQLGNYIKDVYIRMPLAVIVDPSNDVLDKTKALYNDALQAKNIDIKIVLVTLSSSSMPSAFSFNNTQEFLAGLNSTKEQNVDGNVLKGILHAAELVPFDSAIFLSTANMPINIDPLQDTVITLLKKRIRLFLLWYGEHIPNENETESDVEEYYSGILGEIAIRTGGEILHIVSNGSTQELKGSTMTLIAGAYSGAQDLDIPVDATMSSLHVNVDAPMKRATLETPNGG